MKLAKDREFYRWAYAKEGEPVSGGERETRETIEISRADGHFVATTTIYDSYSGVEEYAVAYLSGYCTNATAAR